MAIKGVVVYLYGMGEVEVKTASRWCVRDDGSLDCFNDDNDVVATFAKGAWSFAQGRLHE